jgi:hypothetical protein
MSIKPTLSAFANKPDKARSASVYDSSMKLASGYCLRR